MHAPTEPNHHADHPGFAGCSGVVAGLGFLAPPKELNRLALDLADPGPDDHLVDIGCGPGTLARAASARGATVTGVDPATVMLRIARLVPHRGRIDWRRGGAEDLPVGDGIATVAWSVRTLHHWPDLDAGLAETARVLAPGGRFVVVERRSPEGATGMATHGWTDAQVERFVEVVGAAGFTDVVVRHGDAAVAVASVRG